MFKIYIVLVLSAFVSISVLAQKKEANTGFDR